MQLLRAVPFAVAVAVAIAACASNQNGEPPPSPAPVVASAAVAPPTTLKSAMKGIEDDWHRIEQALEGDPSGELPAVAAAATRCAAVMRLAYDPWEDQEVPDFAKMAHEAEDALLEFAKAAGSGDAATVRALGAVLQENHCARCHDAVEEVHG